MLKVVLLRMAGEGCLTVNTLLSMACRLPRNMCTMRACSCFCIESPTTSSRVLELCKFCNTCTWVLLFARCFQYPVVSPHYLGLLHMKIVSSCARQTPEHVPAQGHIRLHDFELCTVHHTASYLSAGVLVVAAPRLVGRRRCLLGGLWLPLQCAWQLRLLVSPERARQVPSATRRPTPAEGFAPHLHIQVCHERITSVRHAQSSTISSWCIDRHLIGYVPGT